MSRAVPGEQLRTLERWRKLQLEAAQAEHAVLAARAAQLTAALDDIRQQIAQTQELLRGELAQARPLSPATLLRFTQFAAVQAGELVHREAAGKAAQAEAGASRERVKRRFQDLSTVRKLGERHVAAARLARQRQEQRCLDEHAASRRPSP
jgi:hypothetical protein